MAMLNTNENSFENLNHLWNFAISSSKKSNVKLVVVKFFAHWCYPCKKIKKTIDLIDLEVKKDILFIEIDIDNFPINGEKNLFSIETIPSLFVFKKGNLLNKITNSSVSKEELESILKI